MLTSIIKQHVESLYPHIEFSPILSAPPKPEHGEYCFGVFTLAKPLGKSPNIIAEEIATELRKDTDNIISGNTIGGYVNITCTAKVWWDIFSQMEIQWARESNGKTIVVDYIGANAGKPLHIWHICTPSIGQVICNIYHHLGYEVIGDSHFGDWGGIFGKLIWWWKNIETLACFDPKYGNFFELKNSNTQWKEGKLDTHWVDFLLDIYKAFELYWNLSIYWDWITKDKDMEARKEFQYLSWVGIDLSNPEELKHHEENIELWKRFTSISIGECEEKLILLNVYATYNIGESFYEWLDLPRPRIEDYPKLNGGKWDKKCSMKDIVTELIEKWIATDNSIASNGEDKSVGVEFSDEYKLPSCILQKKDGTGLYLTSDLAAIKYRLTNGWNPSKIIYSVDVRQQLHLRQAFAIAKMAWPELTEWVEFFHAFNGFIKLKEWAMSTRHGTVIFLENLISEWSERIEKVLEEKWRTGENKLNPNDIEAITVGAIKYSYLSQDREKDVTFDWDKALSFEGNSGPYIQYACVRAAKVAKDQDIKTNTSNNIWDLQLSQYDTALIRTLAEMETKIQETANKYKPHTLALYCYDLAVCFNSFYVHTPKILEEQDALLKNLRLNLCKLTSEKLTLGFDLLGIEMPSEM